MSARAFTALLTFALLSSLAAGSLLMVTVAEMLR